MTLSIPRDAITRDQSKLFRELFRNFTCGIGRLTIRLTDTGAGQAILAPSTTTPGTGKTGSDDYTLEVDTEKAVLSFNDSASLAHAFFTMLSLIEARTVEGKLMFTLPVCRVADRPSMTFRGIHICVFRDTGYYMLRKFIRMAGFAKYSHVVIEFWGTFRYQCCPGMSAREALTASQVRTLVREANAMGMQVIPMLNCLGHAAQSRAIYCKHVALDQDPKLAPYFEPDGWTWNLANPDTRALLRKMRRELMEACGAGDYFHIGCDEAFPYGTSRLFNGQDKLQILIDYLNEVSDELKVSGRRALMWGDQMLWPEEGWAKAPTNIAYAESPESAARLQADLSRDIVIADWEYYAREDPMPTSKLFKDLGFDVIVAPFDDDIGTKTCIDNVVKYGYTGFLQTTWHLMHGENTRMVLKGGDIAWNGKYDYTKMDTEIMIFQTAAFQRKLLPAKGRYLRSGLRKHEIVT